MALCGACAVCVGGGCTVALPRSANSRQFTAVHVCVCAGQGCSGCLCRGGLRVSRVPSRRRGHGSSMHRQQRPLPAVQRRQRCHRLVRSRRPRVGTRDRPIAGPLGSPGMRVCVACVVHMHGRRLRYPMLTTAAANLLRVYGTEEQKAKCVHRARPVAVGALRPDNTRSWSPQRRTHTLIHQVLGTDARW